LESAVVESVAERLIGAKNRCGMGGGLDFDVCRRKKEELKQKSEFIASHDSMALASLFS
jgi:hypothetical protein